jgi:hypothetical protein
MKWEVTGTTPNRVMTMQWQDFSLYSSTTTRGAFHIKLYETTNVIEIVYRTTNWNSSVYATVGIEDDSRPSGILAAANQTSKPPSDYRFTPY